MWIYGDTSRVLRVLPFLAYAWCQGGCISVDTTEPSTRAPVSDVPSCSAEHSNLVARTSPAHQT